MEKVPQQSRKRKPATETGALICKEKLSHITIPLLWEKKKPETFVFQLFVQKAGFPDLKIMSYRE